MLTAPPNALADDLNGVHTIAVGVVTRREPDTLIHEPKVRLIAAATLRDRIVHHALHRVVAPVVEPPLIDTTFACIAGRGSHRALLGFLRAQRQFEYVLLLDIRGYFPSIRHTTLLGVLEQWVKDPRVLGLCEAVMAGADGLHADPLAQRALSAGTPVGPGLGLPIGNLTSQWGGNVYLSGLDHFIKRVLCAQYYILYMFVVLFFSTTTCVPSRPRGQPYRPGWHASGRSA